VADFNPAEVRRLLPFIVTVDISGDPRQFRFTIIGEAHKEAIGRNLTGMTTDAIDASGHEFREDVEQFYHRICDEKEPIAPTGRLARTDRSFYPSIGSKPSTFPIPAPANRWIVSSWSPFMRTSLRQI
jgi:hypothetical protein